MGTAIADRAAGDELDEDEAALPLPALARLTCSVSALLADAVSAAVSAVFDAAALVPLELAVADGVSSVTAVAVGVLDGMAETELAEGVAVGALVGSAADVATAVVAVLAVLAVAAC